MKREYEITLANGESLPNQKMFLASPLSDVQHIARMLFKKYGTAEGAKVRIVNREK